MGTPDIVRAHAYWDPERAIAPADPVRVYDPTSSSGRIDALQPRTEFELQAWLYNRLKLDGFDVRGEVRGRTDGGKTAWFDLIVSAGNRVIAIIEVKDSPGSRLEKTKQGSKYRTFGVPVFVFFNENQYSQLRTQLPALMQDKEVQLEEPGILAWFDGACEPINPGGVATFAAIVKDQDGIVLSKDHGIVGKGKDMSNNLAEYAGARQVLRYLATLRPGRVTIHGDSNLVINQLNGKWRIKKGLYLPIAMETKEFLACLRGLGWEINFRWIPRVQNEECDALSRRDPSGIQSVILKGGMHRRIASVLYQP